MNATAPRHDLDSTASPPSGPFAGLGGGATRDDTRYRLARAAIGVFAKQGYHGASTREICERAGANSAAIHYHFRDKAGLYRALFQVPMQQILEVSRWMDDAALPRLDRLRHFYRGLLSVLGCDEVSRQLMLLHAREQVEPSGVLGTTQTQAIRPYHDRLTLLLCREFALASPDDALHALAFAMVGLGTIYFLVRPEVEAFAPALLATPESREVLVERSAMFGVALIEAEQRRRCAR
jgi:AcrR family transcriptional regulator